MKFLNCQAILLINNTLKGWYQEAYYLNHGPPMAKSMFYTKAQENESVSIFHEVFEWPMIRANYTFTHENKKCIPIFF